MKIVKQFEDYDFFCRICPGPCNPNSDMWRWGLSDNGHLCYQMKVDRFEGDWHDLNDKVDVNDIPRDSLARLINQLTIGDMVRIVKEFGPLMSFL